MTQGLIFKGEETGFKINVNKTKSVWSDNEEDHIKIGYY